VHESGIASHAFQDAHDPSASHEAVGRRVEPERLSAVLDLVAGDLARAWRTQRRTREPGSRNGAALRPTSHEQCIETVELSQQQSVAMAGLPEDHRVVGVEPSAPIARKSTWEITRIHQNGRLTAAVIAARRRLATAVSDEKGDV
jgi:hypothetical protein